jgi:hypothetical protein
MKLIQMPVLIRVAAGLAVAFMPWLHCSLQAADVVDCTAVFNHSSCSMWRVAICSQAIAAKMAACPC